ncbi:MAG: hypothetical protein Q8R42_00115, partial [Desulfocapsaceae bacterium]|nr:hypothetical protein [Desulfocapsaceae bacterium]
LDEVISAEKYDEDTEDSYGEIANIIAGSYTKVFEEMSPENCRFVRKTQELILPLKVDIGSDEPVPDQLYYQIVTGMILNGRELGNLVVLLPAAPFGLEEDEPTVVAETEVSAKQEHTVTGKAVESDKTEPAVVAPPVNATPDLDVKKHRKRVDALLESCRQKIGVEMGALLGVEVALSDQECRLVSKEDYFMDEASGKQILAHMDVVGEVQGNGYLFVGLKDAIYIGGTLIMLPAGELEKVVIDEAFGDDTEDAYGEIANIVSGVYSAIFEEQYVKKIRFVKTGIEQVLPLKVDTDSDAPMPNQFYYMSSSTLNIGGKTMGKMQMLFPAVMLQLDGILQQEAAQPPVQQPEEKKAVPSVERVESAEPQTFDVLVVSNDALETEKIMAVLERRHLSAKVLSFKENVTDYLPGEVKAVLLVMSDVNEKAFALAIKINAA